MKTWYEEDGETLFNLDLVTHIQMEETQCGKDGGDSLYDVVVHTADNAFVIGRNKDWNTAHASLSVIGEYLNSPEDEFGGDENIDLTVPK